MPRLVLISDTHNKHLEMATLPEGDILIHAGDFSARGSLDELLSFNDWLGKISHRYKVLVSGNHDHCFQRTPDKAQELLTNAIYLQDRLVEIEGLRLYGSPWQPWFFDWAFNLSRGSELRAVWEKIPDQTDVLITHTPPYGILDTILNGKKVGCEELATRVKQLRNLRLHVFGHIHEADGEEIHGNVRFVNASICTVEYQPDNSPVVVDL